MNVDLESAQVLRAGDSFMPTNDPAFSNIDTTDTSVFVQYFIKACHVHVKRSVVDHTPTDFQYANLFPELQTTRRLRKACQREGPSAHMQFSVYGNVGGG